MKNIISTSFLLFLFLNSFGQIGISIPVDDLKIKYNNGDKVYINRLNYFEYELNNYLIDSAIVKNQTIRFNKINPEQEYYVLSTKKETPLTYLPLRQLREHYTSMFCSNFYAFHNYLLVENEFHPEENDYLIYFQKQLSKKSFDQKLMKKGEFKKMPLQKAKKLVEKRKEQFLNHLQKNNESFSNKFNQFIETEIKLAANNQFLNWYEATEMESIENEFAKANRSNIHEEMYYYFLNNKWNKLSIQYFRTIERILNYKESKNRNKFNKYYADIKNRNKIQSEIIRKTAQ